MILITGGTGYIGRHLVSRLLEQKADIRVFARRRSVEKVRAEEFVGDIADPVEVKNAIRSCDAVIHLAALRARWHRQISEFERVNVDGTRTVLEAAMQEGVKKFIHISTAMVLGPSHGKCKDESDDGSLLRFVSEYQRTKYLADRQAERYEKMGLPLITLFPGTTYGPSRFRGESTVTDITLSFAGGHFVPCIGNGNMLRNLVYVESVVEGILLALDKAKPRAKYILGGDNVSQIQLLDLVIELAGRDAAYRHVPLWTAKVAGWVFERIAPLTGKCPFSRATVDWLSQEWMVSSEKAERELGYRPLPLREGLRLTLAACLNVRNAVC